MKSVRTILVFVIVFMSSFFTGFNAHSSIQVAIPDTSGEFGEIISIPVFVSEIATEDSVYSFEMILTFDNNVVTADSAYTTGTIAEGWGYPTFNDTIPGQMRIAMAGVFPLNGSGVLVYVVFIVTGSPDDTTTIHFDSLRFNDPGVYAPPFPADTTVDGLFTVAHGTGIRDENELRNLPTEVTLFQNYPNPFNPVTTIGYALLKNGDVDLTIYDIMGQKVRTLFQGFQKIGYHSIEWDGTSEKGVKVASGIYFYRIKAGQFTQSKKMMITK
jgi:hypothetical protein